jgi:putative SOS response-associated peptidase YedK
MCGRYVLKTLPQAILEALDNLIPRLPHMTQPLPRYNIAPSQDIPVIRHDKDGKPVVSEVRWGLIPSWAKDPSIGNRMINARAETLGEKPAFRDALARRRCLVPASGFYEWKASGKTKQPFYIHPPEGDAVCFGGLWERWKDRTSDTVVDSATIITVPASSDIETIHDRMPLIIPPDKYGQWLNRDTTIEMVREMLIPYVGKLDAYPVNSLVNKPSNECADCLDKAP